MSIAYTDAFITIGATEYYESIEFYRQLLGQEPQPYLPDTYAEFKLAELRLGIFRPNTNNQQEFANSAGSGMSICLEVENLEAATAHLTAMGYPPSGEIMVASHGREIYAYDPAGNRLILHQSG
ncbi:VOC family protein [Pleurocapsales cyanobacterium LEGE 06147]|nr:VOC family protein [Pleurocapsales cyanobacterium LEGE 06147]